MATLVSLRCRLEAGAQGAQQGEDGTIEGRTNTLAIRRAHHGPGDVLVLKRLDGEPAVEHRRSPTLSQPAGCLADAPGVLRCELCAGGLSDHDSFGNEFLAEFVPRRF